VADGDVISMFWHGTMCRPLVHELSCDQPNTTKVLFDITTQHASGEEVVGLPLFWVMGKRSPAAGE
jgi:hypothetical protein